LNYLVNGQEPAKYILKKAKSQRITFRRNI